MGFVDDIRSTTDSRKKIFLCLFSPPNAGKTILSSRIGERSVILTDEAGDVALDDFPEYKARVVGCKDFTGLNDFRDYLSAVKSGKLDSDTLIVDTFTGIQRSVMEQYMAEKLPNGSDNPNYFRTSRGHPNVPALADYNLAEFLWNPVLRMLAKQDLVNVIMNCHVRMPNPDKYIPGDVSRPRLPDAVYQALNGKANMVCFLSKNKDGSRSILTQATDKVAGKSQIKMPPVVSDDEFVKRIHEWQSRSV